MDGIVARGGGGGGGGAGGGTYVVVGGGGSVLRVVVGYGSGFGIVVDPAALDPVAGRYAAPKPPSANATTRARWRLQAARRRRVIRALQFDVRVAAPFASPQSKNSNVTPEISGATWPKVGSSPGSLGGLRQLERRAGA